MGVMVLGSIGRERIENKNGTSGLVFGGTAYYGAATILKQKIATFIVSVIGSDLSKDKLASSFGELVDLNCLSEHPSLPSFFWHAKYSEDLETTTTLELENQLYDDYTPDWNRIKTKHPRIAWSYLGAFLPEVQLQCCKKLDSAFVLTETIGYWIKEDREGVLKAFASSNGVVVNQSEFRELWGYDIEANTPSKEASLVRNDLSLEFLIVTFGASGAQVFAEKHTFFVPAIRCDVVDTTGAGNAFCGGLLGYLVKENCVNLESLTQATVNGIVLAGAQVMDFGDRALQRINSAQVAMLVSEISAQVNLID